MPYPMPGQVPIYWLTLLRSWQTWRFVALLAAELERNGRAVEITRRLSPENSVDPLRASVLGGVEFLMGRTIFSIQWDYMFTDHLKRKMMFISAGD